MSRCGSGGSPEGGIERGRGRRGGSRETASGRTEIQEGPSRVVIGCNVWETALQYVRETER